MAFLLPALVALLPLLITPGILFHYDITPKIVILSVITAGCLALPGETSRGIAELWRRKSGRWLCGLATAQVAWYAVAAGLSSRPLFSVFGSNWRRMGLFTVVALCTFTVLAAAHLTRAPNALRNVLRAFAIAAIIASIYGILQYFDIDPLQAASAYHAEAGDSVIVRPPGTLGNADYFGWWLAIALFCALALARIETGFCRGLALAACVLAGAAIVLSGTRSAILAVAAGFLCLACFTRIKPARKHVIAVLAFAGILAAFYFSPAGARLKARVHWSSDEPVGGARPLLWRDSLIMAAARPWTGSGPETFAAAFPRYQSVALARLLPDFYHESPHNAALDALTEQGIPGLVIALGWAALGGYAALRTRSAPGMPSALVGAALIASLVASVFGGVTIGPLFATLLVIALLVASDPPGRDAPPILSRLTVAAVSVPVAICLAGFGIWLAASDLALAGFQRAVSAGLYERMVRTRLPGAAEDLYCARRLGSPAAIPAAIRSISTSDNPPNAWYNLAILRANQNDAAGVEHALRSAEAIAPNWFKPHWSLANLLALTGREDEARREAERAVLLDAGKDDEVTETLKKITHPPR
jgi:O-antigen ligase